MKFIGYIFITVLLLISLYYLVIIIKGKLKLNDKIYSDISPSGASNSHEIDTSNFSGIIDCGCSGGDGGA